MCEGIEKLITITTMVEIISEYVKILSTGEKRIAEKQKVTLYQEYKLRSCDESKLLYFLRDHFKKLYVSDVYGPWEAHHHHHRGGDHQWVRQDSQHRKEEDCRKQKVTLYQEYKWSSCVKYNFSHFFRDHVQNLASA